MIAIVEPEPEPEPEPGVVVPTSRFSRVAVFAALFPPAFLGGGPIRTLEALLSSAPRRFSISLLTSDRDLNAHGRLPVASNQWVKVRQAKVYFASIDNPVRLIQALHRLRLDRPQVLYLNSFFNPKLSILPQLLWRAGFWGRSRRLVAPRGEFGHGALQRRTFKKRAFIFVYRLLRLDRDVWWHASSEGEAADIVRVWGSAAQVVIREDETSLPSTALSVPETRPESFGLRAAVLGRVVEHKGLMVLLQALATVAAPVILDVFGPEEDATFAARCRVAASRLPDHVRIEFRGILAPEVVRSTLSSYDVLLMPTAGENFGHVIAESLSASCPVVCTPYTPWTETLEQGGGHVVEDRSVEAWGRALNEYAEYQGMELRRRRVQAGEAYARWKSQESEPHVFELFERQLTSLELSLLIDRGTN